MITQRELSRRQEKNLPLIDDDFLLVAQLAAARAVLAVMPAADDIAKEAGLDHD